MQLSFRTRLFLVLFFLGFAGILSFLLVDFAAVVALFPVPPGTQAPTITPAIRFLSLIQPTVLLAVAVLLGVVLASRVGLSSPFVESIAAGRPAMSALRAQVVPGALGALVGGALILVIATVFRRALTAEQIERITEFGSLIPLPTRFLYGGLTEELLLRWGFMTLVVWATWRLFQKGKNKPAAVCFIVGILVSSVVFGLGHLPAAVLLLGQATVAVVVFVIVANSAFGVVAGYLFWRYGLESAMIAHVLCHVVLAVASYGGAYF